MAKLIMFHGKECPHCNLMMPRVDKLAEEEGVEVEKFEIWHDEKNAQKMEQEFGKMIEGACGGLGVPAFVKPDKKEAKCGEMEYEELKKWVLE